ncbi:hypothetical protein KIN34_09840 [Cellulomonas sp. DKR-3]|uniref:Uncharacterized protein n=1 Tax=Cellulomonas fulva TaxID=2835530 RepID=A0ABS5TZR4_9CELL|nr:hypothetical protein [Cellulomonas fulva]MBT0994587.1 hypothetical protein [Cellulomonas fulva]
MTTAVVATDPWQLEAVRAAAAAGAFADDAPVLLVVATLDPVPEVQDSLLTRLDRAGRACFDEVHDLDALVAPQHPAAWDARDLAEGADRARSALGGVDRVVRPAGAARPPVLPLLLPAAREVLLVGDLLDVALLRSGTTGSPDADVVTNADLAPLAPADRLPGRDGSARAAVRWTAPARTGDAASDLAAARRACGGDGPGTTSGGAPATHPMSADDRDALLAAVGVLAAGRHGVPGEPAAADLARARARLRAAARRPGLEELGGWSAAAARAARRRRGAAGRARLVLGVRRVRGALRRRVDRLLRRVWERRVLARAARDVRDPRVVGATTRRAR